MARGGMGANRTLTTCLLLLALVGSPLAAALASTGELVTSGTITLAPTTLQADPIALVGDSAGLTSLQMSAPAIKAFCYYERHYLQTTPVAGRGVFTPFRDEGGCEPVGNATIQLVTGNHAGWYSLTTEGASASFTSTAPLTISASKESVLSSPDAKGSTTDLEAADQPYFHKTIGDNHLAAASPGTLLLDGPIKLKLKGPDFLVKSDGVERRYETDDSAGASAPVNERIMRWAYLEVEDASLQLTTTDPVEMAVEAISDASVNGTLEIPNALGFLEVDRVPYIANGTTLSLEGTFVLSLHPTAASEPAIAVLLTGDAASTPQALAKAPSALPGGVPLSAIIAAAVVVGAGATGAGAWAFFRRREARTPFSLDDCTAGVALAFREAELSPDEADASYEEVIRWARRGRRVDPSRAHFLTDEATALAHLGKLDDALAAYEEAHALADDGEPALVAANLLTDFGRPSNEVAPWAARILEKAPEILEQVEEDFPEAVAAHPDWPAVRRKAIEARL